MLLETVETKKLAKKNETLMTDTFKLVLFPEFPVTSLEFASWWKEEIFPQMSESPGNISPQRVESSKDEEEITTKETR